MIAALPLAVNDNLDAVIAQIGDVSLVRLSEAGHDTRAFYRCHADISKRLIVDAGFGIDANRPGKFRRYGWSSSG